MRQLPSWTIFLNFRTLHEAVRGRISLQAVPVLINRQKDLGNCELVNGRHNLVARRCSAAAAFRNCASRIVIRVAMCDYCFHDTGLLSCCKAIGDKIETCAKEKFKR